MFSCICFSSCSTSCFFTILLELVSFSCWLFITCNWIISFNLLFSIESAWYNFVSVFLFIFTIFSLLLSYYLTTTLSYCITLDISPTILFNLLYLFALLSVSLMLYFLIFYFSFLCLFSIVSLVMVASGWGSSLFFLFSTHYNIFLVLWWYIYSNTYGFNLPNDRWQYCINRSTIW